MHENAKVIDLGLGKWVSNFGTYLGNPAVFIEPAEVAGEVGAKVPEASEPTIKANDVRDDGIILVIHDPRGARVIIEDLMAAIGDGSDEETPQVIFFSCTLTRGRVK